MSAYVHRNKFANVERVTGSDYSGSITSDVILSAVPLMLRKTRSSIVNGEGMFLSVDATANVPPEYDGKIKQGDFIVPLPKKNNDRYRIELIDEVMDITGRVIYLSLQMRKWSPYEEEQ